MKPTVLVCLPFAGAGASFFRKWRPPEPERLTVLPVQLPGREERFADPLHTDVDEAVEELSPWVLSQIRDAERTAVFGHSFGAALAYELARRLAEDGVAVFRLFVSGAPGPRDRRVERLSGLDDAAFLEGLRRAAGYRHPAMDHPEMLEIMMPALRADAAMHERYRPAHAEPVDFPITTLRGRDDGLVSAAETAQWARETKAEFNAVELDGPHMYLTDHTDVLLRAIARELEEK